MNKMREVLECCKKQKYRVTIYCGSVEASEERYIRSVGDEIIELGNSPEPTKDKRGQEFINIETITNCYVSVRD